MSYYGYASSGYYGSGYGAYSSPGPFYRYNASGGLQGPGSRAYYQYQSGNQTATSYAYEGYNGSLYLRNTYHSGSFYQVDTEYQYSNGSTSIDRLTEFSTGGGPIDTGIRYGSVYYDYGGYAPGFYGTHDFYASSVYSYSYSNFSHSGNASSFYIINGSYGTRTDGSYAQSTSVNGAGSYDGHEIAGTEVHGTTITVYDASSGYFYSNAIA